MNKIKFLVINFVLMLFCIYTANAQYVEGDRLVNKLNGVAFLSQTSKSTAFEMRYFTKDSSANGPTDLKGEKEWLDLNKRIEFLRAYANYAATYFGDTELSSKMVSNNEIKTKLEQWKPQPNTAVRKTIDLTEWRKMGYREGQKEASEETINSWITDGGISVLDGKLTIDNSKCERLLLDTISWRFKLEFKAFVRQDGLLDLILKNGDMDIISIQIREGDLTLAHQKKAFSKQESLHVVIEGDLQENGVNCYINGQLTHDFVPFINEKANKMIDRLEIGSLSKSFVDDIFLLSFENNSTDSIMPYRSRILIDESFDHKGTVDGWMNNNFDDNGWEITQLPAVHGGMREAGESLYLRKEVFVDTFQHALLEIESLDPAGEIWINGEIVAVTTGRQPQKHDISSFLRKGENNLIAIRVKPYYTNNPMLHAPDDRHIGWFLGRSKLILTQKCVITSAQAHTTSIDLNNAIQTHTLGIQFNGHEYFNGSIAINYYPWFPNEGACVASIEKPIKIRPRISNTLNLDLSIPNPELWSGGNPNLYKVEVVLRDSLGEAIDDYVFTTGVRTIEQKKGELLINGKPELLNGVQIMGFRTPIETMAKFHRCTPVERIAEYMLLVKKMGANMLRIHVHAEKDTVDGINDPRFAELADQLGIYLLWTTSGFMREGEAWNIDFENYPKYIAQVYNHPSIVIWEASNHPNRFKFHDASDTHDFVRSVFQMIYSSDSSRLISPTTFWQHTHYANHEGTLDRDGKPIQAVGEFYSLRMTRGSQDAYSGYGREWSEIRKMPNAWAGSVLKANNSAYFNFEHEESASQPNWNLQKGKPWYKVPSYEWKYEEGSIGKKLDFTDWRVSQAYQAFSAWESMKKQILIGYDGFSWCTLEGGANMGTYQKPLMDNLGHPKLAFYIHQMVYQRTWAASDDVDVVYGPEDYIKPVIHHLGESAETDLLITLRDANNEVIDMKSFKNISLPEGRNVIRLPVFQFENNKEGIYFIQYELR